MRSKHRARRIEHNKAKRCRAGSTGSRDAHGIRAR
jgi:hypothetical protein